MARAKAINVKIPTVKVIAGLEQALAKLELDWANQETNEAKYEKAREVWHEALKEFAIANIKSAENFRTSYRSYNNRLNIDYDIIVTKEKDMPVEPEREYEQLHTHEYRDGKKEISNAIRLLKMTDEETVSTSTYNAIAEYL
jgi:hypothetical protein